MRIDLHTHSEFSKRPALWLLQKLGCPESYTEPERLYEILLQRGMTHVVITDHNTIDGGLAIAHLPHTFLGEEVTAYFPEDHCKIHVLVYDIDETIHAEIQEVRENLFELVAYLQSRRIRHTLAHPLSAVNDRLEAKHFEQLLLLFQCFELNGDQDSRVNETLRQILGFLTPALLERLAEKHGITPAFPEPWKKRLIGGSDDHSALHLGLSYTEVPGARTVDEFFDGVADERARLRVQHGSPQTMAHGVYAIAYRYIQERFGLERVSGGDLLLRFLDQALVPSRNKEYSLLSRLHFAWRQRRPRRAASPLSASMGEMLREEAQALIQEDPRLMEIVHQGLVSENGAAEAWFAFVNRVSNKALNHFARGLFERLAQGRFFDLFHGVGSAASLYAILAPYFVAFSMYATERRLAASIRDAILPPAPGRPAAPPVTNVAHFTDTLFEVNGVARTLHQNLAAARRLGKRLTLVSCYETPDREGEGIRNFIPVGSYSLPEYPEQKLLFPPFLEMLNWCHERGVTHLHAATPGPVGLAALGIARILKRPVFSTYHTALPQYAAVLTGDASVEEWMWRYLVWFYRQMDLVLVSSQDSMEELVSKGIPAERIRLFLRGVDTRRFHPDRRTQILEERFGVPADRRRILYVGRISREKNLPRLVEVFRALATRRENLHLVVVGDGPYREEMATALEGLPATFTGYLGGADLPAVYAACDLFIFPSVTDTFGNVVLEAQASGLPVVVSDRGGPREIMTPGVTGLVALGHESSAFIQAVESILDTPRRLETMKRAARAYAKEWSYDAAFAETWTLYETAFSPAPVATPSSPSLDEAALFASAIAEA